MSKIKENLGYKSIQTLRKRGLKVGTNLLLMNGVIIDPSHCWLISIGDNVVLAPNVNIIAHDTSTKRYLGYTKIGLINIGNEVFIGANSVILPGVNIGDNSVIGAGSVVNCDIPKNVIAVGNPCRVVCKIEHYEAKNRTLFKSSHHFDDSYTMRMNVDDEKKREMVELLKKSRLGFVK